MKTYLVTGGAGFIGTNFVRFIVNENIKLITLDALTYAGNLDNITDTINNDTHIFIKGDICDKTLVKQIFDDHDIDIVIHFAAESHVDRSIEDPEVFIRTNVLGTACLINAAKAAWQDTAGGFPDNKRFVHISTDEVYGSLGETGYFTEETPISPRSPYSASKASSDLLCLSYFETYGFPVIVTRCSNNYGPYQYPEKLIPLMIQNTLAHKPLPVYGDGGNVRDWLYVEDHVSAIHLISQKGKPGEVYNIGGHNEKRNIEIVNIIIDTILETLPAADSRRDGISKDLITYVKDRLGHDRRYAIDPAKLSNELGWHPQTDFETGIKQTVKWYLKKWE